MYLLEPVHFASGVSGRGHRFDTHLMIEMAYICQRSSIIRKALLENSSSIGIVNNRNFVS